MLRKLNNNFQENLSRPGIPDARARWLRNTALWGPIVYTIAECTSTVSCIWPDDGSTEPKRVAEFLILLPI